MQKKARVCPGLCSFMNNQSFFTFFSLNVYSSLSQKSCCMYWQNVKLVCSIYLCHFQIKNIYFVLSLMTVCIPVQHFFLSPGMRPPFCWRQIYHYHLLTYQFYPFALFCLVLGKGKLLKFILFITAP